jgi:hypothetical protein
MDRAELCVQKTLPEPDSLNAAGQISVERCGDNGLHATNIL